MEYCMRPPLCAETDLQSMRMHASLELTRGDAALTPTAVQWVLSVGLRANGAALAFDVVENLLRCFVAGAFTRAWAAHNEPPMYEQHTAGFTVVFSRGGTLPPATPNRRQVTALRVALEFAPAAADAAHAGEDALFGDVLRLADYAFCVLMRSVEALAPAVFTAKYARIASLQPLFRPLKLALGLPRESCVLEQIAERAVVSAAPPSLQARAGESPRYAGAVARLSDACDTCDGRDARDVCCIDPALAAAAAPAPAARDLVWRAPGEFFRPAPFESRRFVVLTGETDEVHECVFLSQLLKQA